LELKKNKALNVSEYTHLLQHPDAVLDQQTDGLEKIVQEFPYFQSARALYLKGLYNQNSFKYNYALKIAAAHSTDRSVLFDFITSDTFTTVQKNTLVSDPAEILEINTASEVVDDAPKLEVRENTIEQSIVASINEATQTEKPETIELPVETISDADFFAKDPGVSEQTHEFTHTVIDIQSAATEIAPEEPLLDSQGLATPIAQAPVTEKLEMGKPLPFAMNEKHSFQEWLQLSQIKPIVREDDLHVKVPDAETEISENQPTPSEVNFEKQKKNELINKFIESSPKIPQMKHDMPIPSTFYEPSKADNSLLMTETLARVYLEQKKYQKAIQAYEILILKYPEKSSFFADRILDIKNLQQNNT